MKPKILLIGCSIRSKGDLVDGCNTEIALGQVREGIGELAEVEYVRLNKWFLPNGSFTNEDEIIGKIRKADGLVFASPCYFGMPSSLFQDLVEIMAKKKVSLFPKVVGFVAVGAKRNGGEETQIVWSAWDIMELGAIVVNDGAPISQFGGVVIAGTKGQAKYDREGLEVCRYLGRRVAETAMILKAGKIPSGFDGVALSVVPKTPQIRTWNFNKMRKEFHIGRCLGHEVCPAVKADYGCCLKDDMEKLHRYLIGSDGIIPVGWDGVAMERTRYLRRDNYRLTYSVVKIPDPRYIPFFIKQNAILCRRYFQEYVQLVSSGIQVVELKEQIYQPIGYSKG